MFDPPPPESFTVDVSDIPMDDILSLLMKDAPYWLSIGTVKLAVVTSHGLACITHAEKENTIEADGTHVRTATCWIDVPDGENFTVLTNQNQRGSVSTDFLAFMAHRAEIEGPVRANEMGRGEQLKFADLEVNALFSGIGSMYEIKREEGELNAVGVLMTRMGIDMYDISFSPSPPLTLNLLYVSSN